MPTLSTLPQKRLTVPTFTALKGARPIVCLTAYTVPVAQALDPHVDLLLVGDSLGMVLYGEDSTLPVTLDDMIHHGRAVVRGSATSLVVIDLPFGSYQSSPAAAFDNCVRVLKETGAAAVKLEGGVEMAETIAFLTARAVPVMAHIGLMPQRVHAMGGYRWQGRDAEQQEMIRADAHAIADAGAFAVVIEGVDAALSAQLTAELPIPTIGIGAGSGCDGQILVTEDMAGFTPRIPTFVKRYADLGDQLAHAAAAYAEEVRNRRFPTEAHAYGESPSKASATSGDEPAASR